MKNSTDWIIQEGNNKDTWRIAIWRNFGKLRKEAKLLPEMPGDDDPAKGGMTAGCPQEVLGPVWPVAKWGKGPVSQDLEDFTIRSVPSESNQCARMLCILCHEPCA